MFRCELKWESPPGEGGITSPLPLWKLQSSECRSDMDCILHQILAISPRADAAAPFPSARSELVKPRITLVSLGRVNVAWW